MKSKYLLILLILCIIILPGCSNDKITGNIIEFSYEYGGINGYWKYNIYQKNGKIYIKVNGLNGIDLNKEKETTKDAFSNIEKIIEEYDVNSWNGFNETTNYTLDGFNFVLKVKYDQGKITAKGNSLYPSRFEEFHTVITKYLEMIIE